MVHLPAMLLPALAAVISLVDGICFTAATDSVPRTVIERLPAITNASCQIECMKNANCESIYYSDVDQKCFILGKPSGATCGSPYSRQVKTNESCPTHNLTANYVPSDPCLKSAVLVPEHLRYGKMPVCPDTPVDGEASARIYVLSVIFPNGTYGVFDNIAQSIFLWNGTTKTYEYATQFGASVTYQPVYAAMCAYYPAGGQNLYLNNDCGCTPLPFEASTGGIAKAYRPVNNPSGACATGYAGRSVQARSGQVDNCDPCSAYTISCIYEMWILAMVDGTKTITFAISNGTCYPKQ